MKLPTPPNAGQVLWLARYGTMRQLVWARTAEFAERKVRTRQLDDYVTGLGLYHQNQRPKCGPQWMIDAVDQQAADKGKTGPQAIRSLLAFALTGQTVARGPDGNG